MKQRKISIWERVIGAADLSAELLPHMPLIELVGERRVLIENHQGVTKYGCCEIYVKVRFGEICVSGTKLVIAKMTCDQLIITGRIAAIQLRKGE